MRDQYAGDVNDFFKFAFLRALAGKDRTLGIAWYYVPANDKGPDGRHLEWRDETAWRVLDKGLHKGLASLSERSIAALERAEILPERTLFYSEPVPTRAGRSAWGKRTKRALEGADLVFLDPDTGIGEKKEKHATYSEIRLLRKPGRAIVCIIFPGRTMKHDALLKDLHKRLSLGVGTENIITLQTKVSVPRGIDSPYYVPRQLWFTVIDPDPKLIERARTFTYALVSLPRKPRVDAKLITA